MLSGCAQNGFAADGSGIKQGLMSNSFISAALLDMYVKCGELEDAQCVFDELSYIDLVSLDDDECGVHTEREPS
jgi:hypothetical protein